MTQKSVNQTFFIPKVFATQQVMINIYESLDESMDYC